MKFGHLISGSLLGLAFVSCVKDKVPNPAPPPANGDQIALTADSVYLYSKEIYYWNTALPDYNTFNPRQYKKADELSTADSVIARIRDYNDNDKSHKYSFATTFEAGQDMKSGEETDYGFFVKAGYSFSNSSYPSAYAFKGWYITYVYPGSDAGLAGVKRGWKLNKINGTQLTGTNASGNVINKALIFDANSGISSDFEFIKPDGSTQINTFQVKKFTANPILYQDVINTPTGRKVGYVVYNHFFRITGTEIDDLFNYFQSNQINELILDLRYNLGGLTATQDVLANYIAPPSANGGVMYTFEYNQQLQNNNYPLLKKKFGWPDNFFSKDKYNNTIKFAKKGSLNLSRVFIIVSDNTASSAELLINNLKPVMNVQLIGDKNTKGKPVGFFGISLFDKVTFYTVSFRTYNRNNQGDYYSGFTPDQKMYDGVDKNWGDQTEDCLYAALYYINNGNYPPRSVSSLPRSVFPELQLAPRDRNFPGMIR